ncbi:Riibonuclease P [gut metagenome]|uniref:Riibonuclease P n=1 Tax=gut metagenome TaxID=749906 RepID=J9GAH7_9ZZZZ
MESRCRSTFGKNERICGRNDISRLLGKGRFGTAGFMKYCYLTGNGAECDRIMISVSKRLFKRAVKRNLLKRRIRESYRLQKSLLATRLPADILLIYNSKTIYSSAEIKEQVQKILTAVNASEKYSE